MVKGPHQEGRLPLGGGSLKYVTTNIDIWALIDPPKKGKVTLVLLVPLRLKKTCWKIPSTSGMRSRKQAPMKTPPEKQDNKDISVSHLNFFIFAACLFLYLPCFVLYLPRFCIHICPPRIVSKDSIGSIKNNKPVFRAGVVVVPKLFDKYQGQQGKDNCRNGHCHQADYLGVDQGEPFIMLGSSISTHI